MRYLSFLIVVLFTCYACGSGARQTPEQVKEGEKWDAVMANHDVVMPLMDKTYQLRKQVKSYLKAQGVTEGILFDEAQDLMTQSDKADESMMDWMRGFKKLGELQGTMSHEEILQYLDAEDQKMIKVKALFDTSLEKGATFLARK